MYSAKSLCRRVGCNALITEPGYCHIHKVYEQDRFKQLKRAPDASAFYSGHKWTRTSRAFRKANPLCAEHKRNGIIVKGAIADHKIDRGELIAKGLDPYDWQYLENLCHACHNKKLRKRQGKAKGFI